MVCIKGLNTFYSLIGNWLRDHTSWASSGIGVKIKSLPKNFWSSVLNFTTSRYTLLFSFSEIYIAYVISYEWSRSVIIPLHTCIFPTHFSSPFGCLDQRVLLEPLCPLWCFQHKVCAELDKGCRVHHYSFISGLCSRSTFGTIACLSLWWDPSFGWHYVISY